MDRHSGRTTEANQEEPEEQHPAASFQQETLERGIRPWASESERAPHASYAKLEHSWKVKDPL